MEWESACVSHVRRECLPRWERAGSDGLVKEQSCFLEEVVEQEAKSSLVCESRSRWREQALREGSRAGECLGAVDKQYFDPRNLLFPSSKQVIPGSGFPAPEQSQVALGALR